MARVKINQTGTTVSINAPGQTSSVTIYDSTVSAFLSATGITDETIGNAINQLVQSLKSASLWAKIKCLYPFVGGDSTATKFNLKSPLDTDSAFRISWGGSMSFSSVGVQGDAITAYGNTHFIPSVDSVKDNIGAIICVADNVKNGSQVDFGSQHVSTGQFYFNSSTASAALGRSYGTTNDVTGQVPNSTSHSSKGVWYVQRISSSDFSLYKSAGLVNTDSGTTGSQSSPTQPVYICGYNSSGTLTTPSGRRILFYAITEGLTQAEVATIQPILESFMKSSGKFYTGNLINRDILALGDSFTAGSLADPLSNAFINLLGSEYSQAVENRGAGGEGAYKATDNLFSSMLNKSVNPYYTCAMYGFNDLRRSGDNQKTYDKLQAATHTIIGHQFINYVISVNSDLAVKANWGTEQTFETYKYKYTTPSYKPLSSTTDGATITWEFSGTNAVVGAFVTVDEYDAFNGDFTVHIDGNLMGTYNLRDQTDGISSNGNPNKTIPKAIPFFGLAEGSHTMVITSITATPATIDYLGTMYVPEDYAAAMLFGEICFMTPAGYATGAGTNNASTPIMQSGTDAIREVIEIYTAQGYPILLFPTNDFVDLDTDIDADNVHPNNSGHQHIFDAIQSVLNT